MSYSRTEHIARFGVLPALVALLSSTASGALITSTWTGPSIGAWSTASNWSSNSVPANGGGNTYNVIIDSSGQASNVLLTSMLQIQNLTINSGDSLTVLAGSLLQVAGGSIVNNGSISPTAGEDIAWLRLDANTTLSGTGMLSANDTQLNRVYGASGSIRLTQSAGHTIRGAMQLGNNQLLLTNNGLIDANLSAGMNVDLADGGTNFNTGTIRSSNGARLYVFSTTLNNAGGLLEATEGSLVDFSGCTIAGGTLRAVGGGNPGQIRALGSLTLDGVTLDGALSTLPNGTTRLKGTTTVHDQLRLDGELGTNATLSVESAVCTLTGGGELALADVLFNRVSALDSTNRLVIAPDFYVHGAGQFGMSSVVLNNHGVIEADALHEMIMALSLGGQNINTGTIRATNGGGLQLKNFSLDNSGGVIEAEVDSYIVFDDVDIVGGTVRSLDGINPGVLSCSSTASFQDTVLQGQFTLTPGAQGAGLRLRDVSIEGSLQMSANVKSYLSGVVDIPGTLLMNSPTFQTMLYVEPPVAMLTGSGATIMGAGAGNAMITTEAPIAHLIVGPGHTLMGRGSVGLGLLRITNMGLIQATNPSHPLLIHNNPQSQFVNDGTLSAWTGNISIQSGTLESTGTIYVKEGRSIFLGEGLHQAGGTVDVDGTLGATQDIMSFDGSTVTVDGTLNASSLSLNDTRLTINATVTASSASIEGSSEVDVQGTFNASVTSLHGGTLSGNGDVNGLSLTNYGGVVSPGGNSTAILEVHAAYEQTIGGTIDIQIGGTVAGTQYDRLYVANLLTIGDPNVRNQGGTLRVRRINGFVPTPAQEFLVVDNTGTPEVVDFTMIDSCDNVHVQVTSSGDVILTFPNGAGPAGDLDHDGVVGGADLGALLGSWGPCEGCCADLNGDATVDGADLGTLLGNWD